MKLPTRPGCGSEADQSRALPHAARPSTRHGQRLSTCAVRSTDLSSRRRHHFIHRLDPHRRRSEPPRVGAAGCEPATDGLQEREKVRLEPPTSALVLTHVSLMAPRASRSLQFAPRSAPRTAILSCRRASFLSARSVVGLGQLRGRVRTLPHSQGHLDPRLVDVTPRPASSRLSPPLGHRLVEAPGARRLDVGHLVFDNGGTVFVLLQAERDLPRHMERFLSECFQGRVHCG
jgi:hypothetical protein